MSVTRRAVSLLASVVLVAAALTIATSGHAARADYLVGPAPDGSDFVYSDTPTSPTPRLTAR